MSTTHFGRSAHLGRYEIIEDLGRGAMGMVLKARDPLIERTVAIKTVVCLGLAPDEAEARERRFFGEAKCAGRLNHPNIVTIHDVGRDSEVAYIAMEYVEGRSLREVLDSGVVLGAERIADITAQVADGLAFAHANDVVHCDVKPGNVMLLDSGSVKIADFGVAVLPSAPLPADGTTIGSPKYMSPEQVTGQRLDGRSDIFSLGALLYEMLTGVPPFSGDNLGSVLQQVIHTDPVAPSSRRRNLHPGFDAIVAKAMAKDPERRYRTAAEMALDLRRYHELAGHAASSESGPASVPPAYSWSGAAARPRPWWMDRAAAGTAMVLTAIVAVRLTQPATPHPPGTSEAAVAQIAAAHPGEAKARGAGTKKASTRMTADVTKTSRELKTKVAPKHKEANWLIKTTTGVTDRQTDFASTRQHAIARSQPEAAVASPVAALPVPEKGASPEQLCADRANFVSRGFCENRVCMQAEWKDHAYCVKRREQDTRSNPLLAASS
jgi:serine/threonine protein kinase